MMQYVDSFYDWLLIVVILLSLFNAGYLINMLRLWRQEWSAKTKDYWFVIFGWTFLGLYGSIENLYSQTPGGSRFVLLLVVTAATFSGLMRKGPWGSDSA